MKTNLLYLTDSYQTSMDANVITVIKEEEEIYRFVLDQTVFYAMGGGQPTDQGRLTSDSWTADVYKVMMKDGEIWHYVHTSIEPKVGDKVSGTINWERRYKNMKVHSAGHVVDFALHKLGLSPDTLMPLKGDHGKKAFIQYKGVLRDDVSQKLQTEVNDLLSKNLQFSTEFMSYSELKEKAIYLQPGLPTNKPLRALTLEAIGTVADGGTQVKSTSEIGNVNITSITSDEESTIIKYSVV